MKRKLFSAVVIAGLFTSFMPAWAATCTTAPVSTYTAAGFSCSIGGLTFSNIAVSTSGFAGTVTFSGFTPVNPTGGEFGLRLDYTAPATDVGSTNVTWTYSVVGVPSISDWYSAFNGTTTGMGITNASVSLSTAGTFMLTQALPTNEVAINVATGTLNGSSTQNNTVNNGTATGHSLTEAFSGATPPPVPLPAALPLFATGLGALGLLGWRRKRKAAA